MTQYTELKRLAEDCKERDIDFYDVSPRQGSTSCDKLVRHYIAAASPDVVLSMIAEIDNVRRANLDCVDHFETLKADYDTLLAQNQALLSVVESAASPHCLEDEECGVCLSCRARAAIKLTEGKDV